MVFYPSFLPLPKDFQAIAVWPFILIRRERKGDAALLAHESVHYERQARWLVLPWWIAYLASPSFRFKEEVLGYRAQVVAGGISAERAARAISEKYHTGRSYEDCLDALKG